MAGKAEILGEVVLCVIYGHRVADAVSEVSEPLSSRWYECARSIEDLAAETVEELGRSLGWDPEVVRRWRTIVWTIGDLARRGLL
ncbi:hypothetical protein [Methanopyrus sp.]